MNKKFSVKDYVLMGLLISIGIALQLIDNMLNFTGIPGGKLGLSNIVSLLNIFLFGGINALIISCIRAFLGALLFSGASSVPYALAGAFSSTVVMILAKKFFYPKTSEIGISILGAAAHNMAQIIVAAAVFQSIRLFSYASVLILVSIAAGFITGLQVKFLNKRFLNKIKNSN